MEKDVVDRPPNKGAEIEKLAVDTMQGCFEKITFAWILRVE